MAQMKLIDIIHNLDDLPDAELIVTGEPGTPDTEACLTIFAVEPWTPQSDAIVVPIPPDSPGSPIIVGELEMQHFLGIFDTKQFFETRNISSDKRTEPAKLQELINYAKGET
jgi:hypothetical protein